MITYPTTIDAFTNIECTTTTTPKDVVNDIQDAVEALEAKVGADSSAVVTSHDYKLNNTASGNALSATNKIVDTDYYSIDAWTPSADSWTYSSADDPTFTATISGDVTGTYTAGMRIRLVQTTTKYFVITTVTYSAPNTVITLYGGTDYDLANAVISDLYVSSAKAPVGFPVDYRKWMYTDRDSTSDTQSSPVQNEWYNLRTSEMHPGSWFVFFNGEMGVTDLGIAGTTYEGRAQVSFSSNATGGFADPGADSSEFRNRIVMAATNITDKIDRIPFNITTIRNVDTKTTFYMQALAGVSNLSSLSIGNTTVQYICAFI